MLCESRFRVVDMAAPHRQPKFSKGEVERSGKILASPNSDPADYARAIDVLEYWKAAFQEPLDEMIAHLRHAIVQDPEAVVVGRIKRNPAIIAKLRRNDNNFSLRTMDDIAGCRVVVPSIDVLREVHARIEELPVLTAGKSGARDYVRRPKADGYRSVHFITLHDAPSYGYTKLHCETQLRTNLQHAWSTALETYDIIARSQLKVGKGSPEDRRLFACISGLFALIEDCERVPGVPENREDLIEEIRALERKRNVIARLRAASGSVSIITNHDDVEGDSLCLLDIDYADQSTRIYVFPPDRHENAQKLYAEQESKRAGEDQSVSLRDVLLVRVSSMRSLADAYPNYSTDIDHFLSVYDSAVDGR